MPVVPVVPAAVDQYNVNSVNGCGMNRNDFFSAMLMRDIASHTKAKQLKSGLIKFMAAVVLSVRE